MNRKLKVNMISESAFTVQGHGVHTAFTENFGCLESRGDVDIIANTMRPSDIVHIHTVGPYSVHKLLRSKGKKVISAHVTPDSFVGSLLGAKYWYPLAKLYLRWLYNRADGVLAVSQEVVDELKKLGVDAPIFLVPNTIDTKMFQSTPDQKAKARKSLGINDEFVVICNGQVQPRKRIDSFINCAKALPKMRFIWVGGIPFKKLAADFKAMNAIIEHPPANVTITGVIDRSKVFEYYRAADLFFLPSIQETFGIVIVEGAAAGLPVLLRDIDQYRLTFGDGYVAGTDDNFAKIIERFATDKAYYQRWAKASQAIARRYDSKAGAERLLEVYRKVLAG
jgi:1,2-diacylglycerol-3-alpha-glucose alpha-1,2-galactosyltransferase